MENKINIAELLKDCPRGMELDCVLCENVTFGCIVDGNWFPIQIQTPEGDMLLSKYGCTSLSTHAKCVIFPKGKTTWEGFVPPCEFKDGDILATDLGSVFYLNTRLNTDEYYGCYVGIGGDGFFHICKPFAYKERCGFATEVEKQKLFKAIKENGYEWDAETKTLRELVPNKFDISTLVPFESRVLVRDTADELWEPAFFGYYKDAHKYPTFSIVGGSYWKQCIPFECNEHLLGKADDCIDFYKTWE